MKFNPDYLDIDDRLSFAEQLVSTIKHLPTPFSMALDAPWGAGKTRFLREPFQAEAINHFNVVFYDAFEHEIDGDPFLSITSQIISQALELVESQGTKDLPESDKLTELTEHVIPETLIKKIAKVKENAALVFSKYKPKCKRVLTSVIVKAISGHTAAQIEELMNLGDDQLEDVSNAISDEAIKQVEDYLGSAKESQAIKIAFQTALADLCSVVRGKTMIVIDELDRCTPSHALKILESIKHLLLTDNTVFLFSYNKDQLRNSIKHIYGETNTDAYLRKFIQIEVGFPIHQRKDREYLRKFIGGIAKALNLSSEELDAPIFATIITALKLQLRDVEGIILAGFRILRCHTIDDDDIVTMWLLLCLYNYHRNMFMRIFIESKEINTETDESFLSKLSEELTITGYNPYTITRKIDIFLNAKKFRTDNPDINPYRKPETAVLDIAKKIVTF